jgi:methylated-DNA-protein-cysteine methyltransferase-like protein
MVPPGRVTTYGAVAEYLSLRSAARQVGQALKAGLTEEPPVPAHRVVNREGLLTGRHQFSPPERMAALLAAEGVEVCDYRVVDFERRFWSPTREA